LWVYPYPSSLKREKVAKGYLKIEGVEVQNNKLNIYVRNIYDAKTQVDIVYFTSAAGAIIISATPENSPVTLNPDEVKTITVSLPPEIQNTKSSVFIKVGSRTGACSSTYPISTQAISQSSWLFGWSYRRKITITENSGSTLTDYQVRIVLDPSTLDDASDFFSKASYDDLRFTDYTGSNQLSFYIELWDEANLKAVVWVKVPSIQGSSTTDIYMYYGNPTVSSASSGSETCILFDDFESYPVGSRASPPWTIFTTRTRIPPVEADFSVQNIGGQNSYQNYQSSTAYPGGAYLDYSGSQYIVTGRVMDNTGTSNDPHPGLIFDFDDEDNWDGIYLREGSNQLVWARVRGGYWSAATVWAVNLQRGVWYRIMVKVSSSGAHVYLDDNYMGTLSSIINPTKGVGFLFFNSGSDIGYFDNICVVNYVSPEPTYSIGGEES
ncbi:MAG TPA: DUF2341 domain-containing protein, partial [Candidatus Bathyarchaeota archaeon]|nr:DUF2341 domain-containing protein [Candidatus Bathyarchaeota archaeon]